LTKGFFCDNIWLQPLFFEENFMTNQQSAITAEEIYGNKKTTERVIVFSLIVWIILIVGTLLVPPTVTSNFMAGPAISDCAAFKASGQLPNLPIITGLNATNNTYYDATPQQIDSFCETAVSQAKSTGGAVGWFFGVFASILLGLFVYPSLTFLPALKADEEAKAVVDEMEKQLGLQAKTPEELGETELAEFDARLALKDEIVIEK
jgi:hypothetical protein